MAKTTAQHFDPGSFRQQNQYKSFLPSPVGRPFDWQDKRITLLLPEAMRLLGELNAYSTLVPNVDFFIRMHVAKEATLSSKIEGTHTTLDEAVTPSEELDPDKRDDWEEVQQYIEAINYSIARLKDLPISMRLVCEAHKILLSNVRGYAKRPGEIRESQNWIGGASLKDAAFIPPHPTDLPNTLSDLEKFWNDHDLEIPEIIKLAIGHYQFETIHPFLDGNGRIGRLLITLQLVKAGILKTPTLYLSDFFERNRSHYYDALAAVTRSGEMDRWIRFFLTGVIETATKGIQTFERIITLRAEYDVIVDTMEKRRRKHAKELIEKLYAQPVVTIKDIAKFANTTLPTASAIANDLEKRGVLKEQTGFKRGRIYTLKKYLDLFTQS